MYMERNLFLYWEGPDYSLISLFRKLIYLHSKNGKGYKVHLINHKNVHEYIKDLPKCFFKLKLAHQADVVRVNVICDYGGIWIDSDTIVVDKLDGLFDYLETKDGFFILEDKNHRLCNGVFGSRPNTDLMRKWKEHAKHAHPNMRWTDIGEVALRSIRNNHPTFYDNYHIFSGRNDLYPVHPHVCVDHFLNKPYDFYKQIERPFQPLIIVIGTVYRAIQNESEKTILSKNRPLKYFLNLSLENGKKKGLIL